MTDKTPVRGSSELLNYAHPAVIGGGIMGSFVGSEIGDKVFGRGIDMTFAKRFGKNAFRGTMGALGAGLTAYGVKRFRAMKKEASLNLAENDVEFRNQMGLMSMPKLKQLGVVKRFNFQNI